MSRLLNRKTSAIIGVAMLLAAAGAYAYWTQTGTGAGSATTGSGSAIIVNQTSTVTNLSPGSTPQALSGTFTNPNSGTVLVTSVTATLSSITNGAGTPACTVADYQINNSPTTAISNGGVIPVGTGGTWSGPTIQMLDDPAENQDACKGATVNITYSSN